MGRQRGGPDIHVIGRGAVSCFGVGANAFVQAVFEGRGGLAPLRRLAGVPAGACVAAEIPAELVEQAGSPERLPFSMALVAAREALHEARARDGAAHDASSTALVLATTKADLSGVTSALPGIERRQATSAHPAGFGSPALLVDQLAEALELQGPRASVSCACASGLSALALAGRWLASGSTRRVLVVGVDALCPFIMEGFGSLLALDPGPCRPFDRRRRGLSLGEGAGALLLAAGGNEDSGCVLAGWGESNDAGHVIRPSRDGAGLALAVERALGRAELAPDAVDVLHLHGTGTLFNDAMEGRSVQRVFGRSPPACGIKGQIGHTLGASGLLESLVAIESLHRDVVPGSVGLAEIDPGITLDLDARPRPLPRARVALKLAAGFGGINAALVFRRGRTA